MVDPAFSVMRDISESKLIPNRHSLQDYDSEALAELAYLHILSLRILLDEPALRPFPQNFCRATAGHGNFKTWHVDSTDLYVMLYGLIADEFKYAGTVHRLRVHMPIDPLLVYRWLRAGADHRLDHDHRHDLTGRDLTHRLFVKLDVMFRIKDSAMRAIRRLVMDWDSVTTQQRRLALTRLLQFMRARAPRGELLAKLNRVAVLRDLELDDVDNRETGEEKPSSLLRTLAHESATAGATVAASVAAVTGGVGGGFDTDYGKSVYPPPRRKKPTALIRR